MRTGGGALATLSLRHVQKIYPMRDEDKEEKKKKRKKKGEEIGRAHV